MLFYKGEVEKVKYGLGYNGSDNKIVNSSIANNNRVSSSSVLKSF